MLQSTTQAQRPRRRQPWPEASVGYEPDGITLTDDGHLLVTLGRANAVAVYRYTRALEPVSPEFVNIVTLLATVAICSHAPVEVGARSILNPVSLLALSCHVSWIAFDESAAAARLDGAAGAVALPAQTELTMNK